MNSPTRIVTPRRTQWGPWFTALLFLTAAATAASAAEPKAKPWQQRYAGDEATGDHVVALWQFDEGAGTVDAAGHGHDLKLRGQSRIAEGGRFDRCLECFPAGQDDPEGAQVRTRDTALSPEGPFTAELWLKPKPGMAEQRVAWLLDCKYYSYAKEIPRANTGYLFLLQRAGDAWRPCVMLGFGEDSETYEARPIDLPAGEWHHLAFTYDGAGTVRVLLDGKDIGGGTAANRGSIQPTQYALTLGGRYGSTHHGTAAFFDQVRLTHGITMRSLAITIATADGRTAFYRMQRTPPLLVRLTNNTGTTVTEGVCRLTFNGEREVALPRLAPNQTHTIEVPVDTSLRPGRYALGIAVSAQADGESVEASERQEVVIAARPLPHRMPVVMWGGGDIETLQTIGFTHHFVNLAEYAKVWDAERPLEPHEVGATDVRRRTLNEHLARGMGAAVRVDPGRWVTRHKEAYRRVDRKGEPYAAEDVCALNPRVQQYAYDVGATVAKAYGVFPALQAALIHTEVRGHTNVCWHDYDLEAFRAFAGYPVPEGIRGKRFDHYTKIDGFPKDRIIPDDDPVLTFYRWFWQQGDGWNPLHTQAHKGLKSTGRDDLWTWYDPAVRVPSQWGSGGGVDVLSQWTYSYPDPIKVGQATDEVFAMAEGRSGQQVMKMTQIIWYRNQTAPDLPEDESRRTDWEKRLPEARFITIAPDHLREAFWSMIARPVRGIMYHGWGSLVPATHGGYRFTHPGTRPALAKLIHEVVEPLGPTLLQVPDRPSGVALLESFASQVYAQRGTRGWSQSWEADMHLILQWAQLQPRILYDETIRRNGLEGVRVLVMPCCDVLTESVAGAVAAFQKKGGTVVADEHLTPALTADLVIESRKRTGKADADKTALQAKAADLRRGLQGVYEPYAEADNADVVTRVRRFGTTDYLFAINDKRTFGSYVGHHGRVMEKGLPNAARLRVRRKGGHVYDLVAHGAVAAKAGDEVLDFRAEFDPGEGRLFMITERPIADIRIEGPPKIRRGESATLRVAVVDAAGRPVDAVAPVHVAILDPKGRPAEFTGAYGAKGGRLTVTAAPAANDLPGPWTIRVRDLAGGRSRERPLEVE